MRAFNGEGLLYDLVHFSAGNLFLPRELQGCREGDKVRLTWKNENVVREERLGDELWCVVMMEDMRFRIVTPEAIESVRRDESADPIAFRNTLYIANSLYINTMFANSFYARNLIRGLITHLCS